MAAVQNAGLALDWVRRVFAATWEELYSSACAHRPGAGGVSFVPYLTGERTPVLSEGARGAFFGLHLGTDRAAILQSAVEGVCYAVRHALEALPGPPPVLVRLAGGGGLNPGFRRLLVDVLEVPLQPLGVRSASAVGSVLLAAAVAGRPGLESPVSYDEVLQPSESAADYEEPYALYRGRSAALVGS
jgi:xylulokinase